ncbi:MAG: hypothetical protein LBI17_02235 [Rickettsiales bacterium]|jgi:hypothetical protein|nr:hypothetical protein [Rickettsiales bacterium]
MADKKTQESPKELVEQVLRFIKESSDNIQTARVGNAGEFRKHEESTSLTGSDVRLGDFDEDYEKIWKYAATHESLLPSYRGYGAGNGASIHSDIPVNDAVLNGMERLHDTIPSVRKSRIDDMLDRSVSLNDTAMNVVNELAAQIDLLEAENKKLKDKLKDKRLGNGAASLETLQGARGDR